VELLRAVGRQVAAAGPVEGDPEARLGRAAAALRNLGGDVEVKSTDGGWRLQGYACPLSAVTGTHPEVCELARSLVEEITGQAVTECCDRSDRPRCAFQISDKRSSGISPSGSAQPARRGRRVPQSRQ
jgi:DeoR family transcriptional regulator, suf operon transcriptional repressor